MIPQDHLVPQHLQRALSRTLGPKVPHLFPQEQHTRTCKLADAATSTTPQYNRWNTCDHFSWPQKQTLTNKNPRG